MKVALILAVSIYWLLFFLVLTPLVSNPFVDEGYTTTGNFSQAGTFDPTSDITSGGIIYGIWDIFSAGVKLFFLSTLFIGVPSLPTFINILFGFWNIFIAIVTILAIISIFWDG